ncbi:restriction endonuclease subunit S [Treponema sp.]|uniref:restriction endonuclease subunit S n=1 Tax=Treponema sp. TaxID=166 RepID=UPI00257BCEA9|nr:restriction endonuclease subunit S [Treponema sp.]
MPEGWAWCRLNQIFNFIDYRGVTPNKIDSGVPLVTAKIEEKNSDCIASTGFYVCKPRSFVFSKFLFYLMTSEYVIKGLNQFMKGDNSPSISSDDIKNWLYPLPPLTEQRRIVAKIEELFKNLDEILQNLLT